MPTPAHNGPPPAPALVRSLLWIDCSGGLAVGILMLVLAAWLQRLYALPSTLYTAIAAANIAYGSFSLVLALSRRRSVRLIALLALANAGCGVVCVIAVVALAGRASIFGLLHLLAECAVVVWLAGMEWRHRAAIASPERAPRRP